MKRREGETYVFDAVEYILFVKGFDDEVASFWKRLCISKRFCVL